jgi:hypothetical protein
MCSKCFKDSLKSQPPRGSSAAPAPPNTTADPFGASTLVRGIENIGIQSSSAVVAVSGEAAAAGGVPPPPPRPTLTRQRSRSFTSESAPPAFCSNGCGFYRYNQLKYLYIDLLLAEALTLITGRLKPAVCEVLQSAMECVLGVLSARTGALSG